MQVVQNAGNPGNGVSVRIRGAASVSASNDPLYVIDGVPMIAGDISQLDLGGQSINAIGGLSVDEVASVDVLKDAAAAAIYGSRGSNGVVLINTKRGAVGRTNVTFNSYVGTQSPSKRLELLSGPEYLEIFNESAANDGYGENFYGDVRRPVGRQCREHRHFRLQRTGRRQSAPRQHRYDRADLERHLRCHQPGEHHHREGPPAHRSGGGGEEPDPGRSLYDASASFSQRHEFWGDAPIPTVSPTSVEEAALITRSPVSEVYAQIRADLSQAEALVTATSPATQVTAGAVDAIQARVALYEGDYATAVAEADEVIEQGYELANNFETLFDEEGQDTPEDIFKVTFNAQDYSWHGYYYISDEFGGLGTVGPSQRLIDTFDPDDVRFTWSIFGDTEGEASGYKFPTTFGAEDFHVIRFAEVLLIKAEALARQGDLNGAVDVYNEIRDRAGLPPHNLGDEVTTQDDVLAAIDLERQFELAFEGDRWPDLVRTGRAAEVLGIEAYQTLYPIPQSERDVAPGVTQNPGY